VTDFCNTTLGHKTFKESCNTTPFSLHNASHRPIPWLDYPVCFNESNPCQYFSADVHRCAPNNTNSQPPRAEASAKVARAARRRPATLRKQAAPTPAPFIPHHAAVPPYAAALCAPGPAAAEPATRPAEGSAAPPAVEAAYEWGLYHNCAVAGAAVIAAPSAELGAPCAEGAWDPALLAWADCEWDVRSLLDDGPL
jgi:hypothetical protein